MPVVMQVSQGKTHLSKRSMNDADAQMQAKQYNDQDKELSSGIQPEDELVRRQPAT